MPPTPASLVARDLILAARDLHPAFDARRHPPEVLLRALSRYQRRLIREVLKVNTSILTSVQEIALPLADFSLGVALTDDFKYPARVELIGATTAADPQPASEIELVAWEERGRWHRGAYIRNQRLYLTGVAADWLGFTAVHFYYVPESDALTTLAGAGGTLVLPNAAESCLVAFLAWVLAKRGQKDEGVEPPDKLAFRTDWEEAEEAFLDEMAGHTQTQVGVVREVF